MMRRRWSLLLGLADDAWKAGAPQAALGIAEQATPEAAVNSAHRRLMGTEAPLPTLRAIVDGMGLKPGTPFDTRKDALPLARRMLAYCAMTPAFQTR
jgi:hypothetical protein